ncbi:helix-turn-helix domain-containing protein [Sphingomonas solaris]|uniref:Helix-turn-helix transcriptional regulator n=1 Tax=Alterirhizorhabdus solaris TaxID=2529389 RepID=A0A558R5G0_9SPHN|nr:helix-turn-helix transcriptional regulator [Sphingomonas solaris]TVV74616.1 helix-turn-helix transcriptional regulator [Sphingomonas solaris]
MPAVADPPPFTSAPLYAVVAELVEQSGVTQRDLVPRVGLSKDQLNRTLKGTRHMSLEEAATILHETGLPARGTLTLALFGRQDLAPDWARSGSGAFLETMIAALPDALAAEIGDTRDRIDPRWGTQAARFVAQRIAHHINELIEREERLGSFHPASG